MSDSRSGDGGPGQDPSAHSADAVGSLAEETAKLLGALSGWMQDNASGVGEGVSGLAAQAASLAGEVNEHLATGAPECTYCPICRVVHAVHHISPEVKAHLLVAATSMAQAVTALMATPGPTPSGEDPGVEHIDLDDDWTQ